MKAERTISVKELQEIQKTAFSVKLAPERNEVIVDGFKRFNATDYLFQQFKGDVCTPS